MMGFVKLEKSLGVKKDMTVVECYLKYSKVHDDFNYHSKKEISILNIVCCKE